jgi:hypothetical protein
MAILLLISACEVNQFAGLCRDEELYFLHDGGAEPTKTQQRFALYQRDQTKQFEEIAWIYIIMLWTMIENEFLKNLQTAMYSRNS